MSKTKIEETKKMIRALSEKQDALYGELCEEIKPCPPMKDFLFDYIHNSNDDSFDEYLSKYNAKGLYV